MAKITTKPKTAVIERTELCQLQAALCYTVWDHSPLRERLIKAYLWAGGDIDPPGFTRLQPPFAKGSYMVTFTDNELEFFIRFTAPPPALKEILRTLRGQNSQ